MNIGILVLLLISLVLQSVASAAWTKVGETTFAIAAAAADEVVNLPGTPAEGDIVIVVIASDGNLISSPSQDISGYTDIYRANDAAPGTHLTYKLMSSTPDSTVTVPSNATNAKAGVVQIWRGVDQTTPIDVTLASTTGLTGMPDPPTYTPVTDGALVLVVGFLDDDDTAGTVTVPSGYSNLIAGDTGNASTSIGSTAMIASKELVTAGAEDPAAFGGSGDDGWHAITVALRPATASGAARRRILMID